MADYDTAPSAASGAAPPTGSPSGPSAGLPSAPPAGGDRSPVDSRRERDDDYERKGNGSGSYERERERSPYTRRDDRDRSPPRRARNPPPPPTRHEPAPASNVLGCFGLSIRTRDIDLEDEFARYGQVEKAVIVYDQRSERSRGFGFVTMRSEEEAARCIEKLNGIELHGRNIRVAYSMTVKPHQSTPGEYMGLKTDALPPRRRDYDDRGSYGRGPPPPSRYDDRPPRRDYDDRRGGGYDDRRGGGYGGRREYEDRRAPLPPPPEGGRGYDDYDRRRRDDSPPPRRRSPLPPPREDYR